MSTGKDHGLPAEYADWVEVKPPVGDRWASIEIETIAEAEAAVIAKRNELFTHNDADRISR